MNLSNKHKASGLIGTSWKIFYVILLTGISLGFLFYTTIEYSFSSIRYIVYYTSISLMAMLLWFDESVDIHYYKYLIGIVLFSLAYRIQILTFGGPLLGSDPDNYATQASRLILTGDVNSVSLFFYDKAPVHIIEASVTAIILGISSVSSMKIYTIIIAFLWPLLAASFITRLGINSRRVALLGAIGAPFLPYVLRYSWNPISQTTSMVLLTVCLFTVYVHIKFGGLKWSILSIITMVGAVFTHKLGPVSITLPVLCISIILILDRKNRFYPTPNYRVITASLFTVFTALQLVILTRMGPFAFIRIIDSETTTTTSVASLEGLSPFAAIDYYTQVTYIYILAILSAVVWLVWVWLSFSKKKLNGIVYTSIAAALAGLSVVMYLSPYNIARAILFSEIFMFILILAGCYKLFNFYDVNINIVLFTVIILVAIGGISPTSIPDYGPDRQYLTEEEGHAKQWGIENVPQKIKTDSYYHGETTPEQISNIGPEIKIDETQFKNPKFIDGSDDYLNKNLANINSTAFAHRSCMEVLYTNRGKAELSYDSSLVLENNHNRNYDSGCVQYYT